MIDGGNARLRVARGLIALALLISACGEDGEEDGSSAPPEQSTAADEARPALPPGEGSQQTGPSDENLVRGAIEAALVSGDEAKACGQYVTERYVRVSYGDREGCVQAQGAGGAAQSVAIEDVEVSGDTAAATAVPTGGPSGGESLTVALVREDGAWKVDALRSDAPVGP